MTMDSPQLRAPDAASPVTHLQLEQVFTEFNRVSAELGEAWGDLERRVAHLSAELTAARSARLSELAAKETLANKLTALMDAMPAGVVVIDSMGRIEDMNPAATAMLGSDLCGRRWEAVLASVMVRDSGSGEAEFDALNGRRLTLAYAMLADNSSRIALLNDISESHRLRQLVEREERLRELGDMAARLAHQLRTPLSSAMLYLSQLASPEQTVRAPEVSARAMERLRQIERQIEGMLRFIRGSEDSLESISLSQLVRETADALAPQLDRAGASLFLDCPDNGPVIRGQREILQNALSNLLDNALASCAVAPQIAITLEARDNGIRLSVSDNGVGIDPELEARIFEPWFTTRVNGTGLGLAVVASAAEAHGGKVEITHPEGGGSCFTLVFPQHLEKASS